MREYVRRVVLSGLASLAVAGSVRAATISNPSFELDTFTVFPGYVSGNSPITGWNVGDPARAGINPGGGSPFADNGVIPAGSQVAFLQNGASSSLSTLITGLTPGQNYKLQFRINSRNDGGQPFLKVGVDGSPELFTTVSPVGGGNPYKYFAYDFVATNSDHTLTLRNDNSGDNTVVVDDFSIDLSSGAWTVAAWTDDASSGIDGAKTYSHAYNFGSASGTSINGIAFTGIAGGNPSASGVFTTAGLPNVFANDGNNVTGGSRTLANDFLYGGAQQSITLQGLIPGGEYIFTLFSVGWEVGARGGTFNADGDRLTINQDQFGDNNGIRVSYHYVATSSTATFNYAATLGASTIHTYGFANQIVNLPAAATIGTQPRSQRAATGENVSFTVGAAGGAPLFYQWFKNGVELPGETSAALNLPGVTVANNGGYSVIVSNTSSSATSLVATLEVGLAMVNRSFEADTFSVFPGYVSGNGPITGWTALGGHGLNPGTTFSPFADNGLIPNGSKVAFMQTDGALSQTVSGFTVGESYYVIYRENARNGGAPAIEVKIGDTTIVPAHTRSPVGAGNPYVEVTSDPFTASATDLQLSFIKSNPNGGDTTALIDDVIILPLPPGLAPSVTRAPQPLIINVGQNASFRVGAFGSLPFTYQWLLDGQPVNDATNGTLNLTAVPKSSEGDYSVIVSNNSGSVTSAVARLTIWEPITTLFNTGLDANRQPLADGAVDPHYSLIVNADSASTDALVENSLAFPIVSGPWLANNASSKWIGPRFDSAGSAGQAQGGGRYVYRHYFDLTGRDPDTVVILGRWAIDNTGVSISVNDNVVTGLTNNNGFAGFTTFTISTTNASFIEGLNSIDFEVLNTDANTGYTGLKVEFVNSNARVLPNIAPTIDSQPASQTNLIEGNSTLLGVSASGTDPLYYQWFKDGQPLPGQTNSLLALSNLVVGDNGSYSVTVSNTAGVAQSELAELAVVYRRVTGLYNTGVAADGNLLADGAVDSHWTLAASADSGFAGPDAVVINSAGSPVPPWLAAGPKSKWIAPRPDQNTGNAEGNYTYQTWLNLSGMDLCTLRIDGQISVDNTIVDVLFNGVSLGLTGGGFTSWTPFSLTNNFLPGTNSFTVVMNNAPSTPNPTALRVEFEGLVGIRAIAPVTLNIERTAPDTLTLTWTDPGDCRRLQSAPTPAGPWTVHGDAVSPYTLSTTNDARYFRVAP